MTVFWDVAPCDILDIDRRFRGSKHLRNVGLLLPDYIAQHLHAKILFEISGQERLFYGVTCL
jgi:hypothetical protein